jgi:hypothetical protein
MATNIVPGLFGVTPESYRQQQQAAFDARAFQNVQLTPQQQANFNIQSGAYGLAGGIGRMFGGEDPQMKIISGRNAVLQQIDQSNPESIMNGAKLLAQSGDNEGAMSLANYARQAQSELAGVEQKRAAATASLAAASRTPKEGVAPAVQIANAIEETTRFMKTLSPYGAEYAGMESKLAALKAQLKTEKAKSSTQDERLIESIETVEDLLRDGKSPTPAQLSTANMASQLLAKPRSFFDPTSGQTTTVPAADPSKAYPLTYKAFGEGAPKTTTVTAQQATPGNLPAASQTQIGEIDASLKKLENSKPELQSFLASLKNGDIKYNATSNTLDLLGATVLPAFGFAEQGGQVKKDEIKRALTQRVNTLLLAAKGTQTEGDAVRAADQIASSTTYLSQARMIGAIEGLAVTEDKLASELGVKKATLQSQGRPAAPAPAAAPMAPAPAAAPMAPAPAPVNTREQKINEFIAFNKNKPTRQQAIDALVKAGRISKE